MVKIAASIMAADFTQEGVDKAKNADYIHFDIMDGSFVRNRTVWADKVSELITDKPKEVHLMIERPEDYLQEFIDAGADRISFHVEATNVPGAIIGMLTSAGVEVGMTLNPTTPAEALADYIHELDYVLVMSVEPGRGGQEFILDVLKKVKKLKEMNSNIEVEIDGGIDEKTGKLAVEAGVDVLVTGTYLFSGDLDENLTLLKNL